MRTDLPLTPRTPEPARRPTKSQAGDDGHTVVNGMAMAQAIVSLVLALGLGGLMIWKLYPANGWWMATKTVFWLSLTCLAMLIDGYLRLIADRGKSLEARLLSDQTGGMVFMTPVWVFGLIGALVVFGNLMLRKPVPTPEPGGANPPAVTAPAVPEPAKATPPAPTGDAAPTAPGK